MRKKGFLLALSVLLALGCAAACGKSAKEKRLEELRSWELQNFTEGQAAKPHPKPLPKGLVVVVPPSIRAKYKAVVMEVADLKAKEIKKFTVRVGSAVKVPGTDYTLEISAYLPNWKYVGNTVTTKDDRPPDPAVRAIIREKGREVFNGFLFEEAKTPSFMTDKYAIGLLAAAK